MYYRSRHLIALGLEQALKALANIDARNLPETCQKLASISMHGAGLNSAWFHMNLACFILNRYAESIACRLFTYGIDITVMQTCY